MTENPAEAFQGDKAGDGAAGEAHSERDVDSE